MTGFDESCIKTYPWESSEKQKVPTVPFRVLERLKMRARDEVVVIIRRKTHTTRTRFVSREPRYTFTHKTEREFEPDSTIDTNKTQNTKHKDMMHMMMMPGRHHPIDALFEDVFGGFPTMHEYGGTQRCGRTMRARSTTAARRLLRDVKVEETSRGYLVTAYVPGASARDVECSVDIDAKGHAKLRLSVGEEDTSVGLPNKYVDVSVAPKASCIDGVLRVAVLKKATRALEVPIRNGADEEDAMDTEDADGMISLSVPGFGVQDISVVLHKPEDSLTVTGDSKTFGKFSKTFKNLPNGVELEHLSASVAHGILTIRMDDPNAIEERDIVVTNLALNIDQETQMVLIRRSVPGVSSADVSCKLNADRTVRVDVSTSNTRATLSTSVPREADLSSIQASCVDGILTVTATRDVSANQSRETRIVVSGDSPAALALEEPSSAALPEADVKDAADAEDFDGKVEDVRDA